MAGFELNFAADGWAGVESALAGMPAKLDLAAARALRKTAQWLRTHSSREIARELGITQSPIRHRYQIHSRSTAQEVKLWVGLEPIAVHYLGEPRQTTTGVRVGHRQYDDAFISPMKSRQRLVWRRKGRERLPIEKVEEDWQGPAMTALERWERRAMDRFVELFEQEARYVLEASA
ncbi:phage tail protein [Pseudomonas aeruginosa]|uniref:phage tail protein n=1 Tax=Pseudomonas aeruginosa TaxID=287 RepID=UPI00053D99AF|nr:phage tail protein [Pseudomonas aeruginosa]MBO2834607.1 phage tail protein [Pseudomonas aeruginosa]HEC0486920.1 phage tail protein [Pseudomonas aeruginosa]HEC1420425.1 phage tail protein [Pseudomonas aeruginosa]